MSRPQTFVFTDASIVVTAVEMLIHSGIRASRISIHLWGREFAVRALDAVDKRWIDQLTSLGGRLDDGGFNPLTRTSTGADLRPAPRASAIGA